jgi:hypothetical protein
MTDKAISPLPQTFTQAAIAAAVGPRWGIVDDLYRVVGFSRS